MKRPELLLILCFGLAACQPKGSLIYQHPNPAQHSTEHVVVVIDYLNLRDDIGKYWDFDSYYHQQTLDRLFQQASDQLQAAGYPVAESYLLTSGLLVQHDFAVEHYIEDVLQPERLYPPYILAQSGLNQQQISQHQEFLGIMVKYIAGRRHLENDESTHRGMQMAYHFEAMDLPDQTAILYMHINQSAAGIIKQLSTLLLTGAMASQADAAYVGLDLTAQRQASAFLVHKGSGQILWKNHSKQWSTEQPISELIKSLPIK